MAAVSLTRGITPQRHLLEEQILFPTFERDDTPFWPYLPRSVMREYIRLTTNSIVRRNGAWVDRVGDMYEREYRSISDHGMQCWDAMTRKGKVLPYARSIVSPGGLLALTATREEVDSVEVALRRQASALYVLVWHFAWVAWARVVISKDYPDLDIQLAEMGARLPNDFVGRPWFRRVIRPAACQHSITEPPPLDDCIGVVLHSETSQDRANAVLWSGISAYDLIPSERAASVEDQKNPEARIWVKSGVAPRFHKEKWGRVHLANGDLVEWYGFLPPAGMDSELRRALNDGRQKILETYGSRKRGDRPWEQEEQGMSSYSGRMGGDKAQIEWDFQDGYDRAVDFHQDGGGGDGPELGAASTRHATKSGGVQGHSKAAPTSRKLKAAAENERRAGIAKYKAIPEGLWQALYLDAGGDKQYLKLLQIRRRFLQTGWPEAEQLKPTEETPMTAKLILRKLFRTLDLSIPRLVAFRKRLADNVRFPMELEEGTTWDNGDFAELMNAPLTKDDGRFLENLGRGFQAETVEKLV